jgi:hypothetical protein
LVRRCAAAERLWPDLFYHVPPESFDGFMEQRVGGTGRALFGLNNHIPSRQALRILPKALPDDAFYPVPFMGGWCHTPADGKAEPWDRHVIRVCRGGQECVRKT